MVVVHLLKVSVGELLVNRLQKFTSLKCKMPAHNETIQSGHIYLAIPNRHLMIKENKILIGEGPMENRYRPSIDALFRSAAVAFGPRVIGIILTGMLEDGASGMYAIRKCGGVCIVQDPDEAKYRGMPEAVLNVVEPEFSVPVSEIGEAIRESIALAEKRKAVTVPPEILKEAEIAERVNVGIEQVENLGTLSKISCPDCGGSLWEINDNGFTRYRCHVGHAFSEGGLVSSMEVSAESSLWIALRMLEERKNLLKQIGDKESQRGKAKLAATYLERSRELEAHARKLKEILFAVGRNPS